MVLKAPASWPISSVCCTITSGVSSSPRPMARDVTIICCTGSSRCHTVRTNRAPSSTQSRVVTACTHFSRSFRAESRV